MKQDLGKTLAADDEEEEMHLHSHANLRSNFQTIRRILRGRIAQCEDRGLMRCYVCGLRNVSEMTSDTSAASGVHCSIECVKDIGGRSNTGKRWNVI